MNYIDLAIVLVLIAYLASGYFKGALKSVLEFLSLIFSVILGFLLNNSFAGLINNFLELPPNLLKVISFLLIWSVFEAIFALIINRHYPKIPKEKRNSKINKYLGLVPESIRGILVVSLMLIFAISLPISSGIKDTINESFLAKPFLRLASGIELKLNSFLGDAAKEAFTLITIKPDSEDSIDLGFSTDDFEVDREAEQQMLILVNQERQKRGLNALVWDEEIAKVARLHSADMFRRGYFAHDNLDGLTPFDRMEIGDITFGLAGENLALAPSVALAHQGLMDSPGHRENILRPGFKRIGIGCQDGGVYGKMFTQNFAD